MNLLRSSKSPFLPLGNRTRSCVGASPAWMSCLAWCHIGWKWDKVCAWRLSGPIMSFANCRYVYIKVLYQVKLKSLTETLPCSCLQRTCSTLCIVAMCTYSIITNHTMMVFRNMRFVDQRKDFPFQYKLSPSNTMAEQKKTNASTKTHHILCSCATCLFLSLATAGKFRDLNLQSTWTLKTRQKSIISWFNIKTSISSFCTTQKFTLLVSET